MKRDIRLARYDVRTGWLPQICPRHGAPATGSRKQKFYEPTPMWVFILLVLGLLFILGLLIGLVVALAITKSEQAQMPTCRQCDADRTQVRLLRVVSGLVGVALLTGSAVAGSVVLLLTGCLVLLIWLVSLSSSAQAMYAVRGRLVDDTWLDLRGVHPDFAAAIRPNPAWAFAQPALGHAQQPAHWQ
jgi:hypothetical protein